jgi:tetratricopeptide (TPR) repeat protein
MTSPISMTGLDSPMVVLRMGQGLIVLQRLRPLMEKAFGEDDPGTLLVRQIAAVGTEFVGSKKDAIQEAERVLAAAKRRFPPDDFRLVPLYLNLCRMYGDARRYQDQLAVAQNAERVCRHVPSIGPQHLHTALALRNVAIGHYHLGQFEIALPKLEESLKIFRRRLGDEHPETISTGWELGVALRNLKRYAEAIPYFERAWKTFAKSEPGGERALIAAHNVATTYDDAGRRPEAIALLRELLPGHRKHFGDAHRETLILRFNLAMVELESGDRAALERAASVLQDLDRSRTAGASTYRGQIDVDLFDLRERLVAAYNAAGLRAKALPLAEQWAADAASAFGAKDERTIEARRQLAATQRPAAGRPGVDSQKAPPKPQKVKAKS